MGADATLKRLQRRWEDSVLAGGIFGSYMRFLPVGLVVMCELLNALHFTAVSDLDDFFPGA